MRLQYIIYRWWFIVESELLEISGACYWDAFFCFPEANELNFFMMQVVMEKLKHFGESCLNAAFEEKYQL